VFLKGRKKKVKQSIQSTKQKKCKY